jgi:urea transport system permease protein
MNTFPDPRTSRRFTLSTFATKWMGQSVEVGIVPVLILLALYLPFAYFVIPESNALHLSLSCASRCSRWRSIWYGAMRAS